MIKKITFGVVILLSLVLAYNLITQIIDSVKSGDRLSQAADNVYKLEAKNKELKKKLSEVQSPEFIEQQARDKLGLGRPGETMVIIPDEKLKEVMGASQPAQQIRLPNWLGWLRVFFH